ncbi:MAG: hypothetical protein JO131_04245 [Gammaproteobacteria bacterium]|nr:hypothetical protein [Gammaproteobacteria bacterium]
MKYIAIFTLILAWMSRAFSAELLQDPTRPPGYITGDTGFVAAWQLDAVIIAPDRAIAIINGEAIKVGEQIKGNKLINITPFSVQLEGVDGKMTLFLLDNSLKIE